MDDLIETIRGMRALMQRAGHWTPVFEAEYLTLGEDTESASVFLARIDMAHFRAHIGA